jgi:hypothetical protein
MSDTYREVTSQSYFGRIGNAIKGVIVGIVIILVMVAALWWNEGRAVKTYRALKEGAGKVITVVPDKVDPALDGELIHMSGLATTEDTLNDSIFGVSAKAIKLNRNVEMYQWEESQHSTEKKKLGGGTETVTEYTYSKTWSSSLIKSGSFKISAGHQNPSSMPYSSDTLYATKATIGAFRLSQGLIGQMNKAESVMVNNDTLAKVQPGLAEKLQLYSGGYYLGSEPANPQIGDVKISFSAVMPQEVSVISVQAGDSFEPYVASNGRKIERLETGVVSAQQMFENAQAENRMLTWVLRLLGFGLIALGISMILKPFSVVADVVPFVGNLLEVGIGIVALLGSLTISMLVISMAWIFYRPLIGIPMLIVAVGSFVGLFVMKNKKAAEAA